MAFRNMISSKLPLVIILGATGTGKTKLSVELAQKYGTEIISADSMQIYKGLDLVTAKATKQERSLVPHHLLDILEPPHQMFTVVDFRNRALKIIDNLTAQGKIPIVVGGTNYYIESIVYQILVKSGDLEDDTETLLWDKTRKRRLDDSEESGSEKTEKLAVANKTDGKPESSTSCAKEKTAEVELTKEKMEEFLNNAKNFTNEEVHEKLKAVDPEMASRLHSNNRRKVLRSIEVWVQTGRRHSEILDEQKWLEGKLRKPGETIIFWLKCNQKVHETRLDARVDSMLEQGLIEELLDFHKKYNQQRIQDGNPPDYTKGVFQTLGFKEFHEYLIMSEEQRASEEGRKLLHLSIENLKLGTRRFARRQNKMVRGRFLEHPYREVPVIYELDTTELSKWDEEVKNKAIHIIESILNGSSCEYEPIGPTSQDKKITNTKSSNYCESCKRIIIGDECYEIHLQSNRHKKVLQKILKEKKQNEPKFKVKYY